MISPVLPRFIGLVGNPKAGKSEVQRILRERFDIIPVDDGMALRKFAVENMGLSWPDVLTQEGKARYTTIIDTDWQNRDILGSLGAALENMFGEHIMPFMATRNLDPERCYSFGSVRKTQGHFFRANGGVVIEVINPLAGPSPYDFDKYDADAVDARIINDAQIHLPRDEALIDLERKVIEAVSKVSDAR